MPLSVAVFALNFLFVGLNTAELVNLVRSKHEFHDPTKALLAYFW
jgi:hypothetical protein